MPKPKTKVDKSTMDYLMACLEDLLDEVNCEALHEIYLKIEAIIDRAKDLEEEISELLGVKANYDRMCLLVTEFVEKLGLPTTNVLPVPKGR